MTPQSGKRIPRQIPRRPAPNLRNAYEEKKSIGCLIPTLVLLLLAAGGGYFAHKNHYIDFNKILDKIRPAQHPDVQIIDPSLHIDDNKPVKAPPKPVETNVTVAPPPVEPPPKPKKTTGQLRAESDEAQRALNAEIAKARESARSLPSFAGIKFGDVMKGLPLALETLPDASDTNETGLCYLMYGPKLPKAFRNFDNPPMVYVTPQSRKIFRIEFTQAIPRQPGLALNPETTNLVEVLSGKLKSKSFSLDFELYPMGDREFVFPLGMTTLTVGEYGGAKLRLTIEQDEFRQLARSETEAFRKEALSQKIGLKALTSDKYPNAGVVKFGRLRMKAGTPKSFCGVVFGSLPPYSAKISTPASSSDPRGFFIDYRKSKCSPFMNFDHGKAEVSAINGAVIAVRLYSNGPDNGLSDAEYYSLIRTALETRYQTKPVDVKGDGPLAEVTYAVGSLEIALGPDKRGGFALSAVNTVLKENW